jgi:carnitine O-acetyltransferase
MKWFRFTFLCFSATVRTTGGRTAKTIGWSSSTESLTTVSTEPVSTTYPKQEFFESQGDYRSEAWLEDANLRLYCQQPYLPRLPVPSLEETIATFLPTALPLAETPEEAESLKEACQKFLTQAAPLQERLLRRRQEFHDSSWLQKLWNQLGYLQVRDPNALLCSYFFQLPNDPSDHDIDTTKYSVGIQRAADALQATALFAQTIQEGTHPVDTIGMNKSPLCMTQYKMLFSACRIARPFQDGYRVYFQQGGPMHAVVAVKGNFFKIPLTEEKKRFSPYTVLSRSALQSLLQQCVDQVPATSTVPKLGWLTATDRDSWTEAYALFSKTEELTSALEQLQSALCVVCLDFDDDGHDEALTERELALRYWHGNKKYSANRWFDKSMQLVVSRQGNMGYVGEHAMADGMPAMALCHYICKRGSLENNGKPIEPVETEHVSLASSTKESPVPIFTKAFQTAPKEIQKDLVRRVEAAKRDFTGRIRKHDLQHLRYKGYGKKAIKALGYPPDAYVQMAMQVAGSHMFRKQVGTYEAAQTRQFQHGRTETVRTVSPASQAFCQAMNPDLAGHNHRSYTVDEKIELLKKACESHHEYSLKAVEGKGVDRHLFGLQMCVKENEPAPDLFAHPLFQRSKRWLISTSTLPGVAVGFGTVDPDGVGIGYEVLNDNCIFAITAEKRTGYSKRFSRYVRKVLDEMIELHDEAKGAHPSVSKL